MRITISPSGGTPAEQVYDQLRGLITTGGLAADDRLPSVRRLAADLGVAPGTIAKAYRRLEEDEFVVSRTGAGTRVSPQASAVSRSVARAARSLIVAAKHDGLTYEDTQRALRAMWMSDR
ncbi:GntR family transcriptional regulator [Microbacterium esteraromaticum]|uniref:GntR family transcriptional regulator n=1 Tax=Microbacterium esteraromaticum TaxID=57043 RepID=A0A939DVT6_9MICO|nr:GntR family transcriptional regulator [Microbacterium esteraromaticum]MBN8205831.1 GntR family transcriptional regulator [Microbacterium esteraromaticum]MBN8415986.1 GntR family transcriptional regulator [Microbacterium esteraromaticum]